MSRDIHDEAASIFYGENTFRMFRYYDTGRWNDQDAEFTFWTSEARYFHHVVVTIDAGKNLLGLDICGRERWGLLYTRYGDLTGDPPKHAPNAKKRLEEVDKARKNRLEEVFDVESFLISTSQMTLRTLIFDFEKLVCSKGMCRKQGLNLCCQIWKKDGIWYGYRYRLAPGQTFVLKGDVLLTNTGLKMWECHDKYTWGWILLDREQYSSERGEVTGPLPLEEFDL